MALLQFMEFPTRNQKILIKTVLFFVAQTGQKTSNRNSLIESSRIRSAAFAEEEEFNQTSDAAPTKELIFEREKRIDSLAFRHLLSANKFKI